MTKADLQLWLRAIPFVPFRVYVRDGRQYDVTHPRMNLLADTFIKIGIPAPDLKPPTCDHTEYVALKEIERIEPFPPIKSPQRGSNRTGGPIDSELEELLQLRPCPHLRLHLTGGRTFETPDQNLVILGNSTLEIPLPEEAGRSRKAVSLSHIIWVEVISTDP